MTPALLLAAGGLALLAALAGAWHRRRRARWLALARLAPDRPEEAAPTPPRRTFLPRFRWLAGLLALAAAGGLYWCSPVGGIFALTGGAVAGVLALELESFLALGRQARLEQQLADALDLMVGALGAGASLPRALAGAAAESPALLRRVLAELVGGLQLGMPPAAAFDALSRRMPLETFLLFSATLAAQWDSGGSVSATLAGVGRVIRDRVEISRRIRSSIAQSQFSTLMILAITYLIAWVMYQQNPAQMREFLATTVGQCAVAGTMIAQTIGIFWMSAMSRLRF